MDDASEHLRTAVTVAAMGERARMRRVAAVTTLVGWLLSCATIVVWPAVTSVVALSAMLGAIGAMLYGLTRAQPKMAWRDVVCTRQGLTIYTGLTALSLPRESLAEGIVRQSALSWQLRVTARDGTRYDIDTPDAATAHRWLYELGLDASARAARVVTNRPLLQGIFAYFTGSLFASPLMAVMMLLSAMLGRAHQPGMNLALTYLTMLPAYWLAARSVGHVDMTIGVDGIYAGRGWLRKFIPLYAVHSATIAPLQAETVAVRLHSNEVRTWRFETRGDAMAVVERINAVLALRQTGLSEAAARALSSQGATTPEAWRDAFVAAVSGSTYRDAALSIDDLTRVLAAPMATSAQRLGAAMALRQLDGGAASTRVRVAAEMVADPALREALEAPAATSERARVASG